MHVPPIESVRLSHLLRGFRECYMSVFLQFFLCELLKLLLVDVNVFYGHLHPRLPLCLEKCGSWCVGAWDV